MTMATGSAETLSDFTFWISLSLREQRIAQRKFLLSDSLSPNQKRHFTFWIKFGLSPKFGLSERLIQKVKSPIVQF